MLAQKIEESISALSFLVLALSDIVNEEAFLVHLFEAGQDYLSGDHCRVLSKKEELDKALYFFSLYEAEVRNKNKEVQEQLDDVRAELASLRALLTLMTASHQCEPSPCPKTCSSIQLEIDYTEANTLCGSAT